jgi:hypothetical protein
MKVNSGKKHKKVVKSTSQNGSKTSTVNKTRKGKKPYRGQGR